MKIVLAVIGFTIVVICLVADSGDMGRTEVNLGYFLVAFGCIMGAALWRDSQEPTGVHQRAYDVFSQLAKKPLSPDDLLNKLTNGNPNYEIGDLYKSVIGKLVNEGKLVFHNGLLEIASHRRDGPA